jgi:hypothetical protein
MIWCGNQYFVAPDHPPCLWFCEACQYPYAFSTGKSDSGPLECVISLQFARRVLWIWSRFWEVQAMAHKECTRAVPWSGQRWAPTLFFQNSKLRKRNPHNWEVTRQTRGHTLHQGSFSPAYPEEMDIRVNPFLFPCLLFVMNWRSNWEYAKWNKGCWWVLFGL